MEKIPTVEEFLEDNLSNPTKGWSEKKRLIEFAKLHVEAALNAVQAKIHDTYHTVCEDGTTKGVFKTQKEALNLANELNSTSKLYHDWVRVDRLNAGYKKEMVEYIYPLENIK